MLPIQPYTFRPPRWIFLSFIVMCVVYGGFLVEAKEIKRKEYAAVFSAVFLCCYSVLTIKRVMIHIDNDGILHRKIFSETFISWKEITAADIIIESHGHGISPWWNFERANKKPYKIDVPYGRKKYNILAEALVMRAPHAQLSNKIIKLSEGKNTNLLLD